MIKLKKLIIISLLILSFNLSYASEMKIYHSFDLGVGIGMDYGGLFGAKFVYHFFEYAGVFCGIGYYIAGTGWNIGIKGDILPPNQFYPIRIYGQIMYGINAAIIVKNSNKYDDYLYNGFTPGIGVGFRFGSNKNTGIDILVNFPIRNDEYKDKRDEIKNDLDVFEFREPWPVGFSLSLHFEF